MNKNPLFINPSDGYGTSFNGYSANWNLQQSIWSSEKVNIDTTAGYKPLGFIYNQNDVINEVNIYLNPTQDLLTVEISEIPKNTKLMVLNMKEVVFMKQDITSPKTQLNVSGLPKGLYYVKIISGKAETLVRFEKK